MTVIVETGSGNIAATSYVSEADLATYTAARGITLVGDPTSLLLQAMDYLESLSFIGYKYRDQSKQLLQWPRADAWVDGWYIPVTSIPVQLPKAQCAIACSIDNGTGPLIDLPRATTMEKIGDIVVQYQVGSSALTINRVIGAELHKLLNLGGGALPVTKA